MIEFNNSYMTLINKLAEDEFSKDGLSIVISGKNIREYINLSLCALGVLHPKLLQYVVVFDDESTDDTKEYCERNNIQRITWKYLTPHEIYITTRVNQIYRESMMQLNTKYLIFLDGDLILTSPLVLTNMFYNIIVKKFKITAQYDLTYDEKPEKREYIDILPLNETICTLDEDIVHERLWAGCMMMDLEYFKSIGLYFDQIDSESMNTIYNELLFGYYDSGSYFFNEIKKRKVPYHIDDFTLWVRPEWKYMFHFGGISCQKNNPSNSWANDYKIKNLKNIRESKFLQLLFAACKFNY